MGNLVRDIQEVWVRKRGMTTFRLKKAPRPRPPTKVYRDILKENMVPLKVCAVCGWDGVKTVIHHRDGNPWNQDIDNLEVLCTKCHGRRHPLLPKVDSEGVYDWTWGTVDDDGGVRDDKSDLVYHEKKAVHICVLCREQAEKKSDGGYYIHCPSCRERQKGYRIKFDNKKRGRTVDVVREYVQLIDSQARKK